MWGLGKGSRIIDMRIVVSGGNSGVALRLERLLAARGDEVAALIRNPARQRIVREQGALPVLCDVTDSSPAAFEMLVGMLHGVDAVVSTAGTSLGIAAAGRADRRSPAEFFADAIERAGVPRYLLLSTMQLDHLGQAGLDLDFADYLRVKGEAEADLRRRELDWTILRAGELTDDPGAGHVRLAERVPFGRVSRDDVAAVLLGFLDEPASAKHCLEVVNGDTSIATAITMIGTAQA